MHRHKKLRAGSYLLFRKEYGHKVWLYEYLQRHELNGSFNGQKIYKRFASGGIA
jgi:hypothetical protein